jgi:hypothetical protein
MQLNFIATINIVEPPKKSQITFFQKFGHSTGVFNVDAVVRTHTSNICHKTLFQSYRLGRFCIRTWDIAV